MSMVRVRGGWGEGPGWIEQVQGLGFRVLQLGVLGLPAKSFGLRGLGSFAFGCRLKETVEFRA